LLKPTIATVAIIDAMAFWKNPYLHSVGFCDTL